MGDYDAASDYICELVQGYHTEGNQAQLSRLLFWGIFRELYDAAHRVLSVGVAAISPSLTGM